MKRIMALALAIALLLASMAALADSSGSRMDMKKLKLKVVDSEGSNRVRLHGMELSVAIGSAEGIPTVQTSLFYGDSQQLDFVMQVVGSRLILCMGGVSGIYYVDLKDVAEDEIKGELMGLAVGTALQMFGANPQMVMDMSMRKTKKGTYVGKIDIPEALSLALVNRVFGLLQGSESMGEEIAQVRDDVEQAEENVSLEMRVRDNNRIWLYLRHGEQCIRLSARMTMTTEPMEFINISTDEAMHDLLRLNAQTKNELQSEMQLLAIQFEHFLSGTGLGEKEE